MAPLPSAFVVAAVPPTAAAVAHTPATAATASLERRRRAILFLSASVGAVAPEDRDSVESQKTAPRGCGQQAPRRRGDDRRISCSKSLSLTVLASSEGDRNGAPAERNVVRSCHCFPDTEGHLCLRFSVDDASHVNVICSQKDFPSFAMAAVECDEDCSAMKFPPSQSTAALHPFESRKGTACPSPHNRAMLLYLPTVRFRVYVGGHPAPRA